MRIRTQPDHRAHLLGGVLADESRELVDTNDFWEVGGISWGVDNRFLPTNRISVSSVNPLQGCRSGER